jgi:hypothetical protein
VSGAMRIRFHYAKINVPVRMCGLPAASECIFWPRANVLLAAIDPRHVICCYRVHCKNLQRMCMCILRRCTLFAVVACVSALHIIVLQELAKLFCRWIGEETPFCPQIGSLPRSRPLPAVAPVVRAAPIRSSIASIRDPSAGATAAGRMLCPSTWSGITAPCRPRSATGLG